jgi:ring-1,2-phenylacetyl-CoA epoxidase subunit PaaD
MNAATDLAPAWAALGQVKDPCLVAAGFDLSIVDLGLVRRLAIEDGRIKVEMTFTEPGCPFTHHVVVAVEAALEAAGFAPMAFQPVWDPIWTEDDLAPDARRQFAVSRSCMRGSAGAGRSGDSA